MGKTEKGALWLDAEKCTPYEFYQYWRNVADNDVNKLIKIFTFIPVEELKKYESYEGAQLNEVKALLAYEITKIVHGEEEANKAKAAAEALFTKGAADANAPTITIAEADLEKPLIDILAEGKAIPSKGEGRRLIQQGGVYANDVRVEAIDFKLTKEDFANGEPIVRVGKKKHYKIVIE